MRFRETNKLSPTYELNIKAHKMEETKLPNIPYQRV